MSSPFPSPGLIEACLLRPWPGNVRELCAEVSAAAALAAAEGAAAVLDRHLVAGAGRPVAAPPATPLPPVAAPAAAPEDDVLLRVAAETLGLAQRTARKLLPPATLAGLRQRIEQQGLDPTARAGALRDCAAAALLAHLEARGHRRSAVAADLGLSRTTLFKLIDDLSLPRAPRSIPRS